MATQRAIGKRYANSLMHYGVLGMKWGRRKDGKPQGFQYGKSSTKRTQPSDDFVQSRMLKQHKTATLSNAEMQTLINRLNLEKQYSKLNPTAVQRGHNRVKAILAMGTSVASIYALSQSPIGKMIKSKLSS